LANDIWILANVSAGERSAGCRDGAVGNAEFGLHIGAVEILQYFDHSIGIATLINIFNYPLYLMGGGVLAAWDFFAPALLAEVEMRSFTYRNTKTRIEKAILGSEAGLYGAAYLPQQTQRTT